MLFNPAMRSRAHNIIRAGIATAALLILVLCGFAARFSYRFLDANSWVTHTTEVLQ